MQESKLRPAKRVAANQEAVVGMEAGLPKKEKIFNVIRVPEYRGRLNKKNMTREGVEPGIVVWFLKKGK